MLKKVASFGIVLALAAAAGTARAEALYHLDQGHAWISFSILQKPWARDIGVFHVVFGLLTFDKDNVTASHVEAEFDTSTVDTSNAERDAEIQGPGFLDGIDQPTITYKSTSIEKTGDNRGIIHGELTMAGHTVPVDLDTTFNGEARTSQGEMAAGFSATGKLNTDDFGMTSLPPLGFDPIVIFQIEVQAIKCGLGCQMRPTLPN